MVMKRFAQESRCLMLILTDGGAFVQRKVLLKSGVLGETVEDGKSCYLIGQQCTS